MKHPENWVLRFYASLLALHPPLFRIEFGEEMLAVFSEALSEVRRQGWLSVLNWCRQEFSSLFALLLRERWLNLRGEKAIMNQMLEENQLDDFDEMKVRTTVTRKEILAQGGGLSCLPPPGTILADKPVLAASRSRGPARRIGRWMGAKFPPMVICLPGRRIDDVLRAGNDTDGWTGAVWLHVWRRAVGMAGLGATSVADAPHAAAHSFHAAVGATV